MGVISLVLFAMFSVLIFKEGGKKPIKMENHDYSVVSRPVFLFFMSYIVIWYSQLSYRLESRVSGLRLEAIVGFALLLIVLSKNGEKKKTRNLGIAPYLITLSILVAVQVPNAPNIEFAYSRFFIDNYVKYLVMSLFIIFFARSPRDLLCVILAWALASWKVTAEGVIGGVTGNLIWQNQGIMRLHGSVPRYGHPNSLAQFALNTLPYVYYLYPFAKTKWMKVLWLSLAFQALYCILYCGSRTSYLGVIILLCFIWWKASRKTKVRLFLVFFVLVILSPIIVPKQYKERFMSSFTGKEKEGGSKAARERMYSEAFSIVLAKPLGIGLGGYVHESLRRFGERHEIHCLYLELATHLGIQGFVAFMAFMAKLFSISGNTTGRIKRQIASLEKAVFVNKEKSFTKRRAFAHLYDLKVILGICNATVVLQHTLVVLFRYILFCCLH